MFCSFKKKKRKKEKKSLGHLPSNLELQNLRRQGGPSHLQIVHLITPEEGLRMQEGTVARLCLPACLSSISLVPALHRKKGDCSQWI